MIKPPSAGITAIVKTTKIPAMLAADPCMLNRYLNPKKTQKLIAAQIDEGIDLFIWGNAESCVTIVAASIPILRVLIRDVKTSYRKYYVSEHNDNTSSARKSRVRGPNHSVVVTAGRRSNNASGSKLDDGSEKSILDGKTSSGKIVRRNEVVIEFQDRKDGESVEYELGHMPA